ncbi:MAG: hypothetical protein GEU73_11170 [Chloroflexi bacterium]|nr:hypothetical protein [Chloroflexota bacterium]
MTAVDELRDIVDDLSETDARLFLAVIRDHDPVALAMLTAPLDDEPETPEEVKSVAKARKRVAHGKVISNEALAQELGW